MWIVIAGLTVIIGLYMCFHNISVRRDNGISKG